MPFTLAELRKRRNMTQRDLGRAVGLTAGAIANYEIGSRKPPIHIARRIAAALGVSVDDIIFPGEVRAAQRPDRDDPSQPEAKAA